jgi:hypothetical protein
MRLGRRLTLNVLLLAAVAPCGSRADAHPAGLIDALRHAAPRTAPALAGRALAPLAWEPARDAFSTLATLAGAAPDAEPTAIAPSPVAGAPAALRPALEILWRGLEDARRHVADALAGLSPADLELARGGAARALAALDAARSGQAGPREASAIRDLRRAAGRVRLESLTAAELALLDAATRATALLDRAVASASAPGTCASGEIVWEARVGTICLIVIGDTGPNTYATETVLAVDLGGDDVYTNNAGGAGLLEAGPLRPPAAMLLDRGEGSDTYSASPGSASQGSGSLGAGLLVDEGGDDSYSVWLAGNQGTVAQGSASFGAGVLWDRGTGNDAYSSPVIAHGTGLAGVAMLLDEGGDDSYSIPYTFDSEGGQGMGCFGGFGALVDRGEGADSYVAAIDDMQGMACVGSLGVLFDGGGPDEYLLQSGLGLIGLTEPATVRQSGYGQGYGELGAVGILLDAGGNDVRAVEIVENGRYEGTTSQGSGLDGGIGLLLDGGGNDSYSTSRFSQGWAFAGIGVLADLQGTDAYTGDALAECQGFATAGAGLFLDTGGTADSYAGCGTAIGGRGDGSQWVDGAGGAGVDL